MKATIWIGIALIVIGVVSLAYGGFTYTSNEQVVEFGPIKAEVETRERVPLPPVLGGISLAVGIVLVIAGTRRKG